MKGRLAKTLVNWSHNNPSDHAVYASEHLLQPQHHHVEELLLALEGVGAEQVLELGQELTGGGGGGLQVDVLVYGDVKEEVALGEGAGGESRRGGGEA